MTGAASTTTRSALTTTEVADALEIDRRPSALAKVDPERLQRVAQHLKRGLSLDSKMPFRWDDPLFWNIEGTVPERSQFFAIGNSINFRFWQFVDGAVIPARGTIEGTEFRGAMYMWRSLRRALDAGRMPLLDAEFLANLSDGQFDAIFSDDHGDNPLSVAREERIANLRDLGGHLLSAWGGAFHELVEASEGSLVSFARQSSALRAFDDPLYKLTMVNAIMHSGNGIAEFREEPLPAIDYHLLRQALRQGILRPSLDIRAKLIASEPLDAGEAYELRRMTLDAFIELSARTGISGQVLDNRFWANRVNCTDRPVCLDPATADRCPFLEACERHTEIALPLEMTRYY
jgi:hypothetical protein